MIVSQITSITVNKKLDKCWFCGFNYLPLWRVCSGAEWLNPPCPSFGTIYVYLCVLINNARTGKVRKNLDRRYRTLCGKSPCDVHVYAIRVALASLSLWMLGNFLKKIKIDYIVVCFVKPLNSACFFMVNDGLTRRLAWIQPVCISINAVPAM